MCGHAAGAQASPLQCVPLADSCLSLGAAACRRAIELVGDHVASGELGASAAGGRVIYAQTDSVFVLFPKASAAEAVAIAERAAQLVTAQFPPQMELKFERVMCPFMLLHVNRYAGRGFETADEAAAGSGRLLVKGIKSMWRQSAPFLSRVLQVRWHDSCRLLLMTAAALAACWLKN